MVLVERFLCPIVHRLFIEKLPKHCEYAKASPPEKSKIKKLLKQALPRAMELKEKLKIRYQQEKEDLEKEVRGRGAWGRARGVEGGGRSEY